MDHATKKLIKYLDDSIIPQGVAQRLIQTFENLDLPTEYQRRRVVVELMKPLIKQVNEQYDKGFNAAESAHEEWRDIVDEQNEWYHAMEDGGY